MAGTTNRRAVMAAVVVAAMTCMSPVQAGEISGTVTFANSKAIPAGRLEIYLQTKATMAKGAQPAQSLTSTGKAKTISFSIPASADASGNMRVVVRLERAGDDWLLARGSAEIDPGAPIAVSLRTVMY